MKGNDTLLLFKGIGQFPSLRRAAVLVGVFTLSTLAFCGEIHDAAQAGDWQKVQMLLKENPNLVSSENERGETPLVTAAYYGKTDVVQLLLKYKGAINGNDARKTTPLLAAAWNGHTDVLRLLLKSGANPNRGNNEGVTALHNASVGGHTDAAKWLLAYRANPNATNIFGETPLFGAALENHTDVSQWLHKIWSERQRQEQAGRDSVTQGGWRWRAVWKQTLGDRQIAAGPRGLC